jgi:transposase
MIYSLLESAKANKLEPHKYLRYLFEKLPFAETVEDYRKLLPSSLSATEIETISEVSLV